jgi:hypothetical protein
MEIGRLKTREDPRLDEVHNKVIVRVGVEGKYQGRAAAPMREFSVYDASVGDVVKLTHNAVREAVILESLRAKAVAEKILRRVR